MWKKKGSAQSLEEYFLQNMNVNSLQDMNEVFKKHYAHSFGIDKLNEAVAFVMTFKDKKVKIVGDYDVDGTSGTSILLLALRWKGFTDVSFRIPHRFSEGFGINETIVDEIDEGLVITVDNGIAQTEVIKKAKDKGLSVVILDHHLPESADGSISNPADYIIDPEAIPGSATFDSYCGAGLAYKFAEILLDYDKTKLIKLLSLATIGTVADVMPLRSENYVIVKNGIKAMKRADLCMPGLYAIISESNLASHMTAHDIGFKIGPIINASSRMNDCGADTVVNILTYEGPYENILSDVRNLIQVNETRKKLKTEILKIAYEKIETENLTDKIPLILYLDNIPEGLIGIVAGDLCNKYKLPAIVLSKTSDGTLIKGSARSCGNYNMKASLDKISNLLSNYGGHVLAAGLSLPVDNLDKVCNALWSEPFDFINDEDDTEQYDIEIPINKVADTIAELDKYEPFGEGNPYPIFKISDFLSISKFGCVKKTMGSNSQHVKFFGKYCDAIGFNLAEDFKYTNNLIKMDLFGTLSDNYYNGNVTHQIEFMAYENLKDA